MPATLWGEVVHHHYVAGLEGRGQRLFDAGAERRPGHRAVENHRSDDAALAQPGDEGRGAPMPVRHRADQPLATGAAAVEPDHLGVEPGLIEKDEAGGIHIALPHPPAPPMPCHVGTILLGRPQASFFVPQPKPAQVHVNGRQAHRDATLPAQLSLKFRQGDVRPVPHQRPQHILLRTQYRPSVPAPRCPSRVPAPSI